MEQETTVKIAATSGCFDILHAGHVYMFEEMRKTVGEHGRVVVLINTDDYLQRVKGRVLNTLNNRMAVLLALKNVDVVLPFSDSEPSQMIRSIEPDFWFKGPEYEGVEIPETPVVESYGGKVMFVQGGPAVHTTNILDKIRQA
jgi:D-beta-D-heptose 7-phosphate kinase/D-beta-D-heptose 1-phosphate adenosyltransferase